MKTVFYSATTLDGFIADEHDSLDWLFVQEQDEKGPLNYGDFIEGVGALCMGATTYQWLLDHIARTGETWPYEQPTWVFTHREFPPRVGVTFTSHDAQAVHAEMVDAVGGKDVWVVGGGDLAGQFADVGLLDELILYIAPVTLGAGRPLFPRRRDLVLLEVAQNKAFVCARYSVGPARA